MSEIPVRLYEGLFLFPQSATADLNGAVEHLKGILTRAEAEILILRKWDERKLAYPIMGQKRGLYILAYFKARATQVANIDRDCNLSEQILRSLILEADYMGDVELELAAKEVPVAVEARLRSAGDDRPARGPREAVPEGIDATAPIDQIEGK